jgi:hypothetical protein
MPPVDLALVWLLLLSPVVNPWYWLWALALSICFGRSWVVAGSVVAAVSYINSTVLFEAGAWATHGNVATPYNVPWPVTAIQMAALVGAIVWQSVASSANKRLAFQQQPPPS